MTAKAEVLKAHSPCLRVHQRLKELALRISLPGHAADIFVSDGLCGPCALLFWQRLARTLSGISDL